MRAALASVLGLGVLAGLIRAEQPLPGPSPIPSNPPIVQPYQPAAPPILLPEAVVLTESAPGLESPGPRHLIRDSLHKPIDCLHRHVINHPWYCWANHNTVGCGSLKAECTFIFGSCRAFYGEPCFKGPPPLPVPPCYGYGAAGCHCP